MRVICGILSEILFELKADRRRYQLKKTHAWLRYQGASEKLLPAQTADLLSAARAVVSQLEGRNP